MREVTEMLEWRSRFQGDEVAQPERGEVAATISRMAVRVVREHTGRGATRARTYVRNDLVVVMMHDLFTTAERTLIDEGQADLVLRGRRALGAAMRDDLVEGVAAFTGRDVVASMADHHVDPDVAVLIFVLGPEPPTDDR